MNVMHRPDAAEAAGLTLVLADRAAALRPAAIPAEIRAVATQCLLDMIGVALPGMEDKLSRIVLAEMRESGGNPVAGVIGGPDRLPALSAALVNGTAAHALDYDDVNTAMPGHPSVAIWPAVLALAEERGASGAAAIAAFVAGYETACRVGRLVAPGHYALGFHATGTLGAIGAAAGCANLLGLDAAATAHAISVAAAQAAGLKGLFGTMCKPLHAGKAAQNGLLAARLAARGFTGRADALECAQGFARTHGPDLNPAAALADPPGGFHLRANLFKYHAACYMTHAPIEALARLRREHAPDPARIRAVRLTLDPMADRTCNIAEPGTGLEAKFSLRVTAAMALLGIETGRLDRYDAALCADPDVVALRDRVRVDFTPMSMEAVEAELHLDDGQVLRAHHDAGAPAEDLADQGRRVTAKFIGLAEPHLGAEQARDLADAVAQLDKLPDLRELVALWVPGTRA